MGEAEVAGAVCCVVEVEVGSHGAEWGLAAGAWVCWLVAGGELFAGFGVLGAVAAGCAAGLDAGESHQRRLATNGLGGGRSRRLGLTTSP